MRKLYCSASLALVFSAALLVAQNTDPGKAVEAKPDKQGWLPLFDGKTLSGWTAPDPSGWNVTPAGEVVGQGKRSHLFSPNTYTNLEFKAEVKLNHRGNSGMYIRAALTPGWPKGYEAQVENTSPDSQKTGSLYNLAKVTEQLVQDDTWWTQHIIAIGNRIIIKVNDKIVVDYVDEKNMYQAGHLALQQHDPGNHVTYRNLMVKPLPSDEDAAWKIARKDMPDIAKAPAKKAGD